MKNKYKEIFIIGGGLAGCECAWQLALRNIPSTIVEMRDKKTTPAHQTNNLAELVCSNSFRSDDKDYNAVGLMHEELRKANSLVLKSADECAVPAGGALAVDRVGFSKTVEKHLEKTGLVTVKRQEFTKLPDEDENLYIVATGPLTSDELSKSIIEKTGKESFSFYDAIAPVIYKDSIDFTKAWYQSRYDKGDKFDYINCPMTKEQYNEFIDELLSAEYIDFHDWEEKPKFFEGCLPIEIMAERGRETLTYGPLKPVGLTNPNNPKQRYHAIVQLRQDNKSDTLRNMVGFQTKLKHSEQKRIFTKIPGLENARFARLGGIHKNSFINSPKVLDESLKLKKQKNIRFAGQITGCEGYVESSSIGLLAGIFTSLEQLGYEKMPFPKETTALGAMLKHITKDAIDEDFQPMNINFGLLPTIAFEITTNGKRKKLKGRDRKKAYTERASKDIQAWIEEVKNI